MKKVKTKDWERIYTGQYRKKRVLSIFPFIIMSGVNGDFHWNGKWFQYVTVKQQKLKDRHLHFNEWDVTIQEQKVKDRYLEFDDGWSYQHYWGKWKTSWVFTKIMKNEKVD